MTKKQRLTAISIWIIAVLLFAFSIYVKFVDRGYTEVSFIDVGQGDSCFIQTDNLSSVLIDGGDKGCGTNTLIPFFKYKSVMSLDAVFVSHLHNDHASGIEELINNGFKIGHIYMSDKAKKSENYNEFETLVNTNNIPLTFMNDDDKISIDNTTFTAINSPAEHNDENELSLVLRFDCGTNSILFTGDISSSTESEILSDPDIDTDILKVAHHGSSGSSSIDFINAVSPELSVISVGENNKYHHPNDKTLLKYDFLDIPIVRTDYDGTISIIMTDNDIRRLDFSRKREG